MSESWGGGASGDREEVERAEKEGTGKKGRKGSKGKGRTEGGVMSEVRLGMVLCVREGRVEGEGRIRVRRFGDMSS